MSPIRSSAPLAWLLSGFLLLAPPGVAAQTTSKPAAKEPPDAAQQKKKAKPKLKAKREEKEKDALKPVVSKKSEERYREGLAHEGRGDHQAAHMAYLDAGNGGHGQAQKKLGDIYGKGNKAVKRDYDVSLRWYEKARAQGVEIPKPHAFTKGR